MPVQRNKLFHAIIFFNEKTRACHKLKLFKLLYFLDFEIFRQTGRAATGLQYFAWPKGPVPRELNDEFKSANQKPDLKATLSVHAAPSDEPDTDGPLQIAPKVKFNAEHFTKRELREMDRLAEIFCYTLSKDMTLASHAVGLPWRRIYEIEKMPQALIPYELALDGKPGSVTAEQAKEIEEEARAVALLQG